MSLKKNVIANFLGQGWSALMAIAFVPLYIKYLGIEAYGLIGIFAILQAWLTMFDMGMTPTLNREMARYKAGAINTQVIRDLLRSIECICATLTLLIVFSLSLTAPLISNLWLKAENLPKETITQSIVVMGFVVAARLWEEVYRGAIRGMQQQVWLNITQATLATLRWAGVLIVLALVSPSVKMFFLWQGFISVVGVVVYAYKMYQWLPRSQESGRFSINVLKSVRHFAGGMTAITVLALLLTQVDKLLLSGILPLEQFGYYVLASMVANGLAQFFIPMNAAIYPRFTELITHNDELSLIKTYHDSCQLLSAIIIPPALILAAFAKPVLLLWTGDPIITESSASILSLLVLGTLFNGFMNVPYMLQLAYGWTSLAIKVNVLAVTLIIPAILLVVPKYGAVGAAWIWFLLNLAYVLIGVHFMYRKLLPEQKWRWYSEAIAKPFFIGATLAFGLAYLLPVAHGRIQAAYILLFASVVVLLSVASTLPVLKRRMFFWRF